MRCKSKYHYWLPPPTESGVSPYFILENTTNLCSCSMCLASASVIRLVDEVHTQSYSLLFTFLVCLPCVFQCVAPCMSW